MSGECQQDASRSKELPVPLPGKLQSCCSRGVARGKSHFMPRHAPHAIFPEPSIYSSISIKKTLGDSSLARLFPICFHIWGKEFSEMLWGFFFSIRPTCVTSHWICLAQEAGRIVFRISKEMLVAWSDQQLLLTACWLQRSSHTVHLFQGHCWTCSYHY